MLSRSIKLNLNEMPYPPPQSIIEAARRGIDRMHRYSEPAALERLRILLAEYAGVAPALIVPGPGSDLRNLRETR